MPLGYVVADSAGFRDRAAHVPNVGRRRSARAAAQSVSDAPAACIRRHKFSNPAVQTVKEAYVGSRRQ